MSRQIDIPCDELRRRYGAGESTIVLARRYQCSPTTIANRLRGCGAELRPARFRAVGVPESVLRQLYLEERLSIARIAERLGVAISTVGNKRRAYQIPVRPRRVATKGNSDSSHL